MVSVLPGIHRHRKLRDVREVIMCQRMLCDKVNKWNALIRVSCSDSELTSMKQNYAYAMALHLFVAPIEYKNMLDIP